MLNVDVSGELKQVRVPVLYLQAAEDKLVPGAAASVITGLAPATEVVALDAPHCLLQAVPEAAARVVTATMERWVHHAG